MFNIRESFSNFFKEAHNKVEINRNGGYAWGLRITSIVTGLALTVLAGVAAYYCFVNGFNYLDIATTRFQLFVGGSLAYMGIVLSIASVTNLFLTVAGLGKENSADACKWATYQTLGTVSAPIIFLPLALCAGLEETVAGNTARKPFNKTF